MVFRKLLLFAYLTLVNGLSVDVVSAAYGDVFLLLEKYRELTRVAALVVASTIFSVVEVERRRFLKKLPILSDSGGVEIWFLDRNRDLYFGVLSSDSVFSISSLSSEDWLDCVVFLKMFLGVDSVELALVSVTGVEDVVPLFLRKKNRE